MNFITLTEIESNKEWIVNADAIDALINGSKGGTEITLRSGKTITVQQLKLEIMVKLSIEQS